MLTLILLFLWKHGQAQPQCGVPYSQPNFKLQGHVIQKHSVQTSDQCTEKCALHADCHSINFYSSQGICELNNANHLSNPESLVPSAGGQYVNYLLRAVPKCSNKLCSHPLSCEVDEDGQSHKCVSSEVTSCLSLRNSGVSSSGVYWLSSQGASFQAYCDMGSSSGGWTLVARFSNADSKNWMRDDAYWWYDVLSGQGSTTSTSVNQDMISPSFWSITGSEIKITRSDDSSHTALLQTTSNCLGSRTVRSKLSSYGTFKNKTIWSNDRCLGSCYVSYGGQYGSTSSFSMASCNGNIQNSSYIGFWCQWDTGDGAVMMIGGGGRSCSRADHGLALTENNYGAFQEWEDSGESDFGDNAGSGSTSYSLNLWIR